MISYTFYNNYIKTCFQRALRYSLNGPLTSVIIGGIFRFIFLLTILTASYLRRTKIFFKHKVLGILMKERIYFYYKVMSKQLQEMHILGQFKVKCTNIIISWTFPIRISAVLILRRIKTFFVINTSILSATLLVPTEKSNSWDLHSHYWIIGGGVLGFLLVYAFIFFSLGYNNAYDALVLFFQTGVHEKSHTDMLSLIEGGIAEAYDQGLKAGYAVGKDTIIPSSSIYETIYVSNILQYAVLISLGLYVIYCIICYLLPVIVLILVIAISYNFLFGIIISIPILCSVMISLGVLIELITTITSALKQKEKTTLYLQSPNI